jgi:hypothetical protein
MSRLAGRDGGLCLGIKQIIQLTRKFRDLGIVLFHGDLLTQVINALLLFCIYHLEASLSWIMAVWQVRVDFPKDS